MNTTIPDSFDTNQLRYTTTIAGDKCIIVQAGFTITFYLDAGQPAVTS